MTSDEKELERLQRDTNYFNEPEQPNPFRPKAEPPTCQHLMVKGEPCHLCEPKASPSLEDAVQKALDVHAEMVKINAPHGQTVHACEMCNALNDIYTATILARRPSYDNPKASPSLEEAARKFVSTISWAEMEHTDLPKVMASFAQQQRRDAVAEFVREFKEQYPGLVYAIEAVAKEMLDE